MKGRISVDDGKKNDREKQGEEKVGVSSFDNDIDKCSMFFSLSL